MLAAGILLDVNAVYKAVPVPDRDIGKIMSQPLRPITTGRRVFSYLHQQLISYSAIIACHDGLSTLSQQSPQIHHFLLDNAAMLPTKFEMVEKKEMEANTNGSPGSNMGGNDLPHMESQELEDI
ncbi:hypothetical protein H5410_044828 [Solanum commersonii]|uniref:Uncharacterized protein n=1 Tax=Solanum commersonii TaxID=4109 RepID=A0A9J5X986_SOLCO|nr:hypothetical protein H5410_044828 [Solanum commersonii]